MESPSGSLVFKFALALASVLAYAVIAEVAEALDAADRFPDAGLWFHDVVGGVFGALVLSTYIGTQQRIVRFAAMCGAGAAIYYVAVWFVTEGPIGDDVITSFILAGGTAALLSGLAVVLIAPRRFSWRLLPLTLLAGALGGAAFELKFAFDQSLLVGHAAWQLFVCLALYFGFRDAPT